MQISINRMNPNWLSNGKRTLASGKVMNINKKNLKCRVVLDDIMSGKRKSKPTKIICSGCLRYFNGIKGLHNRLSKSPCLHKEKDETNGVEQVAGEKEKVMSYHPLL